MLRSPRRQRRRLRIMLFLSAVLSSLFVLLLIYWPVRVPFVLITATPYGWPLPPNAWVAEDAAAFDELHNQTLQVMQAEPGWRNRAEFLDGWRKQLQAAERARHGGDALLMYVSAHGVVDEQGRPCLIPPAASALRSEQWIPLSDMLAVIGELIPASAPKLLMLDCSRQSSNWSAGLIHNTFNDRVAELVGGDAERTVPGLVILNSAGPQQRGWASAELNGSVFGRAVMLGLAGEADRRLPGERSGVRDGAVTVKELYRYVARSVREWSEHNRVAPQTPQLIPENPRDFRLAGNLSSRVLKRLSDRYGSLPRRPDAVTDDEIAELWRAVDGLRTQRLAQVDPFEWSRLERRLVWLEQAAQAGNAYQASARKLHGDLKRQLADARRRLGDDPAGRAALAARAGALRNADSPWRTDLQVRSLALAEQLGVLSTTSAARLREQSTALLEGRATLPIDAADPLSQRYDRLDAAHYLKLLTAYQTSDAWKGAPVAREAHDARQSLERLISSGDERTDRALRSWWSEADRRRRQAEDATWIGPAAGEDPWPGFQQWLDEQFQPGAPAAVWYDAWHLRDRIWARSPYLAQWLSSTWWRRADESNGDDEPVEADLIPILTQNDSLARRLDVDEGSVGLEDELQALRDRHEQLESRFELAVQSLLQPEVKRDAATWQRIEQILATPIVGAEQRATLRRRQAEIAAALHAEPARATPIESADVKATGKNEAKPDAAPSDSPDSPVAENSASQVVDAPSGDAKELRKTGNDGRASDSSERARLIGWSRHPMLLLAGVESFGANTMRGTDATGAELAESGDGAEAIKQSSAKQSSAADDAATTRNPLELLPAWEAQVRIRLRVLSQTAGAGTSRTAPPTPAVAATQPTRATDDVGGETDSPAPHDVAVEASELSLHGRLARDERAFRSAAALLSAAPPHDPVADLRSYDLQQRLLWFASRSLDDYYGAGPRTRANIAERPFFAQAAGDYLEAAERLTSVRASVRRDIQHLHDRLQRLGEYAGCRVSVQPAATPPDGANEFAYDLELSREAEATSESSAPGIAGSEPLVPPGRLVAFTRRESGAIIGGRLPLDLPDGGGMATVRLIAPLQGKDLLAVAAFRGHEWTTPVTPGGVGGPLVEYQPQASDNASVIVLGDRPQQASILFVLDCSASMKDPLPAEATGENEPQMRSRIESAKGALGQLLDHISRTGNSRVGVRFFGHRVGWSTTAPVRMLRQPNYTGDMPADLMPNSDVELVLPLGRFEGNELTTVLDRLDSVRAWGQSPLYLSLLRALDDFDTDLPGADRSIVVITDGANYPFSPSTAAQREPVPPTSAQVLAAVRGRGVPIYILGVGLAATSNQGERAALIDICRASGGSYFDVASGGDLLRTLQGRLGAGVYRVEDGDNRPIGLDSPRSPGVPLNRPIQIDGLGGLARSFQVKTEGAQDRFRVEGGESVVFQVAPGGRGLIVPPYDRDFPVAGVTVSSGRAQRYLARVHRPEADPRGIRFSVSIQDENLRFTPRPAEMWVEVTPVMPNDAAPPRIYSFYDRQFVQGDRRPGVPWEAWVPRVEWLANDWPVDARQARVNVWFKFERTANHALTVGLRDWNREKERFAVSQPIPNLTDASYRILATRSAGANPTVELRVLEEHGPQSPGFGALRVLLETDAPVAPLRIARQFDSSNRTATHAFTFDAASYAALEAHPSTRFVFTLRQATRAGAWSFPNDLPLEVDVFTQGDKLPLNAASGNNAAPPP